MPRRRVAVLLRMAVLALWVTSLAGCELQPDPSPLGPTAEQPMVHALLFAGQDTARVLLTRVPASGEYGPAVRWLPLEGAYVRLLHEGEWIPLRPGPRGSTACMEPQYMPSYGAVYPGPGCYAAPIPGGIRAGATYELDVQVFDGGRISATAVVPRPVELMSAPVPGQRLRTAVTTDGLDPGKPFALAWSPPPAGSRLELSIDPVPDNCIASLMGDPTEFGRYIMDVTKQESFSLVPFELTCSGDTHPPEPAAVDAEIVLTTYSPAFARYLEALDRNGDSIRLDEAAVGVTGALGVFAGAAEARVRVVLVRE